MDAPNLRYSTGTVVVDKDLNVFNKENYMKCGAKAFEKQECQIKDGERKLEISKEKGCECYTSEPSKNEE